jgi:UDP-N-acetyl-alpha-D-muramoyl-L-alanyl-L-glutamate epimerase
MDDDDRFDPRGFDAFRVIDRTFDKDTRTVTLEYALDDSERFVETVTFETPPASGSPTDTAGFERALLHLHVAAGTSYYKTAAPPVVSVEGASLTAGEISFHHHLYDNGLREFAVRNGLPVPRPVAVRAELARTDGGGRARSNRKEGGLVVPIGGGKDSVVLAHALRNLEPRLLAVNPHPVVIEAAGELGLDVIVVRRQLSPRLGVLNRLGARNGHVPITAVISLIAVAGSFLYGYDAIAMAIERSASEETRMVDGVPVNHQYSKSLEFERLLQTLVTGSIDPGLTYGSALRRYSELSIARAFASLTGLHATFCSCNQAFRQSAHPEDRWCGGCAKCRFVALMLAPYLTRTALAEIIGRDLFADPGQVAGFTELMSPDEKPFECVGERRESAAAFALLAGLPEWRDSVVVATLAPHAVELVGEEGVTDVLSPAPGPSYPVPAVAAAVDEALDAA